MLACFLVCVMFLAYCCSGSSLLQLYYHAYKFCIDKHSWLWNHIYVATRWHLPCSNTTIIWSTLTCDCSNEVIACAQEDDSYEIYIAIFVLYFNILVFFLERGNYCVLNICVCVTLGALFRGGVLHLCNIFVLPTHMFTSIKK